MGVHGGLAPLDLAGGVGLPELLLGDRLILSLQVPDLSQADELVPVYLDNIH